MRTQRLINPSEDAMDELVNALAESLDELQHENAHKPISTGTI
jgi:hypothetical protein